MSAPIQFMDENRQGVTIVHILSQRLIDPNVADILARHLCALLDNGALKMLVEMGAVERISSVYFRSFIMAGKKASEKRAKIAFCNLTAIIKEGFSITGMDKLFKIYDNESRALAEIGDK